MSQAEIDACQNINMKWVKTWHDIWFWIICTTWLISIDIGSLGGVYSLLTFGFQITTRRFLIFLHHTYIFSCITILTHHLTSGFLPSLNIVSHKLYTCNIRVNVCATRGSTSVSKYTHDPYFSAWISHCAFGFLSAELALQIIFLAILSIFTWRESGWLIPSPTKKSPANITHLVAS